MLSITRRRQRGFTNTAIQEMAETIQRSFPGSTCHMDMLSRETIVTANVNGELLFCISLPYNFPAMPPTVSILNAASKYLAGLELSCERGLLELRTGRINYPDCFTWTPEMRGDTFVYLCAIILKTAAKLAQPETVAAHLIPSPSSALLQREPKDNGGNNA